jgi:hypothetical protein
MKYQLASIILLSLGILINCQSADPIEPFIQLKGPLLVESGSLLDSLFQGNYNAFGDIYYDLKNEGYYSPNTFEGYVSKPVFELAAAAGFDLDFTLLGMFHVNYKTRGNLIKVRVGLQTFLSTRYLDNLCLMGFG